MKVSLNVATYNWKDALRLVLESIQQQTVQPTEVVITDDGSSDGTQALIEQYKKSFSCPLIHLWQEDSGFRLARARNMGIAKSSGEYIVQIDGDMILHERFIEDHIRFARSGFFSQGGRVILPKALTTRLLQRSPQLYQMPFIWYPHVGNRKNGLRLPALTTLIRNNTQNSLTRIRGCNQAFFREDLIKVNGYNEAFTGWGSEDYELVARLMKAGVRKQNLKFGAIAYHLYHNEAPKDKEENNIQLYEDSEKSSIIQCQDGLQQHL